MTHPPAPLEWHPAYRDQTWLLAWVEGRGGGYPERMQIPIIPVIRVTSADEPSAMPEPIRSHTLLRHRAHGLAPYVGRPFIYRWWCAVDELGRGIAGELQAEHTDTFASHHTFEVYHYHWDARNGHDPGTPVWP